MPTAPPTVTSVGPADRDPTASLRPFVAAGAMSGAVTLVADRDGVRSLGAVGWADIAAQRPMAADTVFWIASMTKPMTGALLMMLVEEGRLALDDPVEKHLPEFAGQQLTVEQTPERSVQGRPSRPITVRDCLAHVSGLPFMSRPEAGRIDRLSLREAAISYAMTPLGFEPGTQYQYSNAGINTAGRVAEVVTGMRYEDLMHERLLAPLGMRDTTFWPDAGQLARLAKTYKAEAGALNEIPTPQFTHPLADRRRQPCPAGGYFSTADDVGRFGRMVLGDGAFNGRRLLSAASVREMTRKQTGGLAQSYGLGWSVDATGCGHGGAVATDLRIEHAKGLVLVYLVQAAGYVGAEGAQVLGAFKAAALA